MKSNEFNIVLENMDKFLSESTNTIKKMISKLPRTEKFNQLFDENGNPKGLPEEERIDMMYRMLKILGHDITEVCLGLFLRHYDLIYKDIEIKDPNYRIYSQKSFLMKKE
ncbi:MAG: hypothetical protein ACRC0S_03990 [Fusobacteriaceae bacterium]